MAYSQDSSNDGGKHQDDVRRRATPSSNDPHKPDDENLMGDDAERAPDDQGNAITDQEVNRNVAERTEKEKENPDQDGGPRR